MDLAEAGAWLESPGMEKTPLRGNCSLGRSPKSAVVLESPKASRRHAIINLQNVGEFWLIDLGSSNGTFLNRRRVHQPVRLCDMDQLTVGDVPFTFRQPEEVTSEMRTTLAQQTIRETANIPVWLLVADIEKLVGQVFAREVVPGFEPVSKPPASRAAVVTTPKPARSMGARAGGRRRR